MASPDNADEAICCGKAGWARRRLDERLDADQRNDEAITQEEEEPRRYEKDEGKERESLSNFLGPQVTVEYVEGRRDER